MALGMFKGDYGPQSFYRSEGPDTGLGASGFQNPGPFKDYRVILGAKSQHVE